MNRSEAELLHDLRMPLQLIQSSAQLIQLSLDDPAMDAGQYIEMLLDSVGQMRRMLNGALEACGRAVRPSAPVLRRADVVRCVREACQRCQAYAGERGIRLTYSENAASLVMALDEDMLCRALLNLIANAMRATPRGGRVAVRCAALGDFVEISVADNGCGIPAERLPYIFLRGETDGGHGYGLPAVNDYARAMGGTLSAVSGPGRGSTFTLRLPVDSGERLQA